MNIYFYTSSAEPNSFPKELGEAAKFEGELRDECDILNPVITMQGFNPANTFNYCYIPDFKRYYFITESSVVRTGVIEFSMHVDVLQSWSKQILEQSGIIARNEYDYDNNLLDDKVPAYNYNLTSYKDVENIIGDISVPDLSVSTWNMVIDLANSVVGV